MNFTYERRYTGPVQAVIFDWAGTLVDHGSLAPIIAMQRLFEENGVSASEAEVRAPMGAEKWAHIEAMTQMSGIHKQWVEKHGAPADKATIDRLYADYLPMQVETIGQRTQLIEGVPALAAGLAARHIKIGTNTGYSRPMLEPILAAAAEQGLVPASSVCATEVPKARPYPFMSFKNMMEMGIENVASCIKVDDTVTGIHEGLNGGMWTVAVSVSGNAVGVTAEDWAALSPADQATRRAQATESMQRSGAHYVIDSVADLEPVIDDIERRLQAGGRP